MVALMTLIRAQARSIKERSIVLEDKKQSKKRKKREIHKLRAKPILLAEN